MALPVWLSSIIGSLFKVGLNFLKGWYEQEKAKEYEWAAKTAEARLESVKDAEKMELRITNAKPIETATTPAAWNSGVGLDTNSLTLASLLLLLILLLTPGCLFTKYVFKAAKLPIIEAPARPQLDIATPFTEREQKLAAYAQQLEAKIAAYNAAAREHNQQNGF